MCSLHNFTIFVVCLGLRVQQFHIESNQVLYYPLPKKKLLQNYTFMSWSFRIDNLSCWDLVSMCHKTQWFPRASNLIISELINHMLKLLFLFLSIKTIICFVLHSCECIWRIPGFDTGNYISWRWNTWKNQDKSYKLKIKISIKTNLSEE